MKTETQWIKTADRAPTEADLPVWLQFKKGTLEHDERPLTGGKVLCETKHVLQSYAFHAIAWRPAKADIPEPPMEETQENRDENAYRTWCDSPGTDHATRSAWHAALAYERAEVAKTLPKVIDRNCDFTVYEKLPLNAIEAIRARCEGRGQ